jgi:integrase/recombinase XerD
LEKDNFLEHVKVVRSGATYATYKTALKRFDEFYTHARKDGFSAGIVEEFVFYLHKLNYKPASIHTSVAAVMEYFKYLLRHGHQEVASVYKPQLPRIPQKVIDAYSVEYLVRELSGVGADLNPREFLAIAILIFTGIRIGELRMLHKSDIEVSGSSLMLRVREGKGAKERLVPIPDRLRIILSQYLKKHPNKSEFLFAGARSGTPPCVESVSAWISKFSKLTGISLTAHTFRRSYATTMIKAGVSMIVVQKLLGHSDIKTLLHYVKVDAEDLTKNVQEVMDNGKA